MEKFETEYKQINTKAIFSDKYQRDLDIKRVKRIVKNFNPNLVNPVKVSFRSGKYWVFDGQHTMAALKERNDGDDLMIDCKVFFGMTYEDEARLFADQDGESQKVNSVAKLRSLYEAKDVNVMEFKETAEAAGFVCDFRNSKGPWRIVCYKEAYNVFIRHRAEHFTNVLFVIATAWDGDQDALRAEMIGGLSLFIHDYAGEFDMDRLVKKLSKKAPTKILREGDAKDYKGKVKYEYVIREVYNDHLINKLPWKHGGEV